MANCIPLNATQVNMHNERARTIERTISRAVEHWHLCGWINNSAIRRDEYSGPSIILTLSLPSNYTTQYAITESELRMSGLDALRYWLDTIEHEIRRHFEFNPEVIANEALTRIGELERRDGLFSEYFNTVPNRKAEKKSKELFIATAGQIAYQKLEAGAPLPITGSEGTPYNLFKRASYCVERPSDGAKLCAVVPDVPLWDHLLGIKLMIEHDEPTFLKIANVSSGFSLRPGSINYFNHF